MDLSRHDYYNKEFIYFLVHPEKHDHYLIIQTVQSEFNDLYEQFNRIGKYAPGNPVTMPHNNVKLVEQIPVPDRNLFGLCYFICNEAEEIKYEEDVRYRYAEWGWYVVNSSLQTSKWLQDYLQKQQAKQKNKSSQPEQSKQISLFRKSISALQ